MEPNELVVMDEQGVGGKARLRYQIGHGFCQAFPVLPRGVGPVLTRKVKKNSISRA